MGDEDKNKRYSFPGAREISEGGKGWRDLENWRDGERLWDPKELRMKDGGGASKNFGASEVSGYPEGAEDLDPAMVREAEVLYGYVTVEDYLDREKASVEKHEYYKGEVFSMAGAKVVHNRIVSNLLIAMGRRLQGKSCRPYNSDQRIHIPSNTLFTYPDLSIVCGKAETLNNDQFNLLNPVLIAEVLSPATRNYDRGAKFKLYRDIPGLREYLLLDSDSVGAELFSRQPSGRWELTDYDDHSASLRVQSLDLRIPFSEIYEGTGLMG